MNMSVELILLTIITLLEFVAFGFIVYEIRNNKAQYSNKEEELMNKISDIEESIDVLADAVTSLVEKAQNDFVPAAEFFQGPGPMRPPRRVIQSVDDSDIEEE